MNDMPGGSEGTGSGPPRDFAADRQEERSAITFDARRQAVEPRFQWPLMIVLVGLLGSLIVVATDHFRRGAVLFAAFVVVAFVLRLVLKERDAGWLAVRAKRTDVIVLGVLALSLVVFSVIVPSPS